jgi:hypothetical protein
MLPLSLSNGMGPKSHATIISSRPVLGGQHRGGVALQTQRHHYKLSSGATVFDNAVIFAVV